MLENVKWPCPPELVKRKDSMTDNCLSMCSEHEEEGRALWDDRKQALFIEWRERGS